MADRCVEIALLKKQFQVFNMRNFITILFVFIAPFLFAQDITNGLVAHYSFDDCTPADVSGNGGDGLIVGNPTCECGVVGQALNLDGNTDHVVLLTTVNNFFNRQDFSVSFYMKSANSQGTQIVLSKTLACNEDQSFTVKVTPTSNTIAVGLSENSSKQGNTASQLDFNTCWQHVVFVRRGAKSLLYLNGNLKDESSAVSQVDIENAGTLTIAGGACADFSIDNRFTGLIDELRVYSRALNINDIEALYLRPDQIATMDQTIFLGESVEVVSNSSCANEFFWSPSSFVSDPEEKDVTITPERTTVYNLFFEDFICVSSDSITITVIDPNDLACDEVFLPKAFTPNGDDLNDFYGISNPFAIEKLISFEIFDRWGGRVFFTDNPTEKWDGAFKGQPMNPGVLLYRVRFSCDGEEDTVVGSVAIIR